MANESTPLSFGPIPSVYKSDPSNNVFSSPAPSTTIPSATEYPKIENNYGWGAWKDRGFAIAFWIHFIIVLILAMTLGIPAIRDDSQYPYDDPTRNIFNYNADLFIRVFIASGAISGIIAFLAFFVLQRCAGRIIKCALYMGVAFQIMLCIVLFSVAWPMGIITLIFVLISIAYIYMIRNRIAFAEAHIQVGCAALRSHPTLIFVSILMLAMQFIWIVLWALMALGFEAIINGSNHKSSGAAGGIFAIVLMTSLFWGALVFRNITHFVTACVVGQWWFIQDAYRQYSVETSVQRAFTTNFGTISFGSLILAFIKALRVLAEAAKSDARRDRNFALLLLSCIAVCIVKIFENIVSYLNEWAFIFSALTGQSFRSASRSFIDLMANRGWTLIINDDLAGTALTIVTIAIGLLSAAIGGVSVFVSMPHSDSRAAIAGMAAFFCLKLGISMGMIMSSILSSGVRTAFVCFALNPVALSQTHPEHFASLVAAWHEFHPQEFLASGYSEAFPRASGTVGGLYPSP